MYLILTIFRNPSQELIITFPNLAMGSVKSLHVKLQPSRTQSGIGDFDYSDDYSILDWGRMPDDIPGKGLALCMMGAHFFESLESRGIRSHYRGVRNPDNGEVVRLSELPDYSPTRKMKIDILNVLKPVLYIGADAQRFLDEHPDTNNLAVLGEGESLTVYDYTSYQDSPTNVVIPAEIIYREELPKGSSVFKRLARGTLTREEMDLDHDPQVGERLKPPFIDVSTKYEKQDRYPGWTEISRLAGLNNRELISVKENCKIACQIMKEEAEKVELRSQDGKIELGFDSTGRLIFVDVLGTPDESKYAFVVGGREFNPNKEIIRDYYRLTQPDWVEEIEKAKREHPGDWKRYVTRSPNPLPTDIRRAVGNVYVALANRFTGREFFTKVPELGKSMEFLADRLAA